MINSNDIPVASSRWIDTADVAKLIRTELKKSFPGIKFSVRSSRAGGSSIDIFWTDGPTTNNVDRIMHAFQGGRFESMTDCPYQAESWYCPNHGPRVAQTYGSDVDTNNRLHDSRCCAAAELVKFNTRFVFTHRKLSPEFTAELAARVRKDSRMSADGPLSEPIPEGTRWYYNINSDVHNAVWRLSNDTTR